MADVVLSAELQARVDSFVANLTAAANVSTSTSSAVGQMTANISRNIASINRLNLDQFNNSLRSGTLSIVTQLPQSIGQLETRLSQLQTAIRSSSDTASLARLGNEYRNVQAIIEQLNRVANGQTFRPLVVGANQAGNALTNLGRVAQDAPFGFIGIQNNLNPLLESFQRLRAETGSNQAAFRALGQSLLGPAGVGIALSVVGSAILFYQQYQQRANKATQDAKKVTDDYIKTLDAVTASSLKGSQNAQQELTNLKLLYDAYQNANLPLKARKEAYEEIQSKYPDYFKNINFEQEASERTANAYKLLTEEILATARARAASDRITQNETRKLENEQKTVDLQKAQIKNLKEQDKLQRSVDANLGSAERGDSSGADDAISLLSANKKVTENLKLQNNLKTDTKLLDEQNARLVTYVNTQLEKGGKILDSNKNKSDKIKSPQLELPDNPKDLVKKFFNEISGINAPGALTVKVPNIKFDDKLKANKTKKKIDLGQLFQFDGKSLDQAIEKLKLQQKLNEIVIGAEQEITKLTSLPGLVDTTAGALGESFSAMGEAIAQGSNVLEAAGAAIQKTFADLLSALGKQFITMGAAKIAAGILASPFGGKLISDGAGLIALGASLSLGGGIVGGIGKGKDKSKGKVTAFANGGIISGPTLGLMGEYAGAKSDPEVVAPLSKLKNLLGETDENGNVTSKGNFNVEVNQSIGLGLNELVAKIDRVRITKNRQG